MDHFQPTKEKLKLALYVLPEDKNFLASTRIRYIKSNATPKEEYVLVIRFWPKFLHNRLLRIHVSLHQRPDPAVPQLPDIFVSLILVFVALSSAIVSEFAHDALK